jgi:hypothetical protein
LKIKNFKENRDRMNRKQRIEHRKSNIKPFGRQDNKPVVSVYYDVKIELIKSSHLAPGEPMELSSSPPPPPLLESSPSAHPRKSLLGRTLQSPALDSSPILQKNDDKPKRSLLMPTLVSTEEKSVVKEKLEKHVVRISNINNCQHKCEVMDLIFRICDFGYKLIHISEACNYAFIECFSKEDAQELRYKFNGLAFNNMVCIADLIV